MQHTLEEKPYFLPANKEEEEDTEHKDHLDRSCTISGIC
jgi:hypothetical protein